MLPKSFRAVAGGVRGAGPLFGFWGRVFFVMGRPYTEPKAWDAGRRERVCSVAVLSKISGPHFVLSEARRAMEVTDDCTGRQVEAERLPAPSRRRAASRPRASRAWNSMQQRRQLIGALVRHGTRR